MLRLDHVLVAVEDLGTGSERFTAHHGLATVEGGRHEAYGTANRIVPLGDGYVELIAAVDRAVAGTNEIGKRVLEAATPDGSLLGWCLRTDDLETHARTLSLPVVEGARQQPDGTVLRWRSVGIEALVLRPGLPFILEWLVPEDMHPGRADADHVRSPTGFAWVEVAADPEALRRRVEGLDVPIRFVGGEPGLRAVGIGTADGEDIVVRSR